MVVPNALDRRWNDNDEWLFVTPAGMAAAELRRAAKHASACAAANGQLEAAWKLLGDIGLAFHAITPLPTPGSPQAQVAQDPAAAALAGYVNGSPACSCTVPGSSLCTVPYLVPFQSGSVVG